MSRSSNIITKKTVVFNVFCNFVRGITRGDPRLLGLSGRHIRLFLMDFLMLLISTMTVSEHFGYLRCRGQTADIILTEDLHHATRMLTHFDRAH